MRYAAARILYTCLGKKKLSSPSREKRESRNTRPQSTATTHIKNKHRPSLAQSVSAVASKSTDAGTTHLLGGRLRRHVARRRRHWGKPSTWHTRRTTVPLHVTTPLAPVTTPSSTQSRWRGRLQPCPCCPCPPLPRRHLPLSRLRSRGLCPPQRQGVPAGPAASFAASPPARWGVPRMAPSRSAPLRSQTSRPR